MPLKTDDEDIRDVRMWMEVGGNGDYYLNLYEKDKNLLIDFRCCMSGGNSPTRVKLAFVELYRALEEHNLNMI